MTMCHNAGPPMVAIILDSMKKTSAAVVVACMTVLLASCSNAEEGTPAPASEGAASESPQQSSAPEANAQGFSLSHIQSCDPVEKLMAPYISGLVADPDNTVDEWGVSCRWTMAEGETNLENAREVEIVMQPAEADAEKPMTEALAGVDGFALVEDPWLEANGGVAYSIEIGAGNASAIGSTVWVPGVEAVVGGGKWGDMPALDGAVAVNIVRELLAVAP